MEDFKICSHCQESKLYTEYNKCQATKDGHHSHCRMCQKKVRHEWYLRNHEKEKMKNLLPEVKERMRKCRKQRYEEDIAWRISMLDKNNIRRRGEDAKIKARIQRNNWYSLPHNKIACALRVRLRLATLGKVKPQKTECLLGISFEEFKLYLEKMFDSTMTWENYGNHWHIDHIIPCSFFDLTIPDHQRICFYYKNMQPMLAFDNISKGNKVLIDNISFFIESIKKDIGLL